MSRPYRARALTVFLVIAAAGCQDYNFNPVGHCLLQPGTQSFTLSNVSSADVLFVVDDSGSMAGEQANLSNAFSDFVDNLTSTNTGRAASGLLPLDFHVAVTTTSVFYNRQSNQNCLAGCAGANGQLACCVGSTAVFGPKKCAAAAVGTTAGCPANGAGTQTTCSLTCNGLKGSPYCCNSNGTFPPWMFDASLGLGSLVTCSVQGLPCGNLQTHYDFAGQCSPATQGVALDELPFPDGDFVGILNTTAVTANPRVLHFDKRLYLASDGKNAQGFTKAQLINFFRQNVSVGTCGSAEEQGLVASRHALEKALSGTQLDTYAYDWARGLGSTAPAAPTPPTFSAPGGIPTLTQHAVWPNPSSKLVVVYVGDEDDCSSPADPSAGVVILNGDTSGTDACVRDAGETAPLGKKQFPVQSFVDYLTGLGRQVGAAFVVSARSSSDPSSCSNETCFADLCCDFSCSASCPSGSGTCGGQAPGTRFIDAATKLKAKGADVVVGSVCSDFRPLLRSVADIVKPPQTLSLPSLPAESAIAILRIADGSGGTRKICGRPLAPQQPTNYTRAQAEATGADWWFTATANPGVGADSGGPYDPDGAATVSVPSRFVYINPKGACIANPGETYSADYLGRVPAGGCQQTPATDPLGALDCQAKLGGTVQDWQCYIPPGAPSNTIGTCTCRSGS